MMSEWHVTPDYIVANWTDELLDLMIEKLVERRERGNKSSLPGASKQQVGVSVEALAARSRGMIKVIKEK